MWKRRWDHEGDLDQVKRRTGRPVGSKTRPVKKVHRRELMVDDWSDTDSMVSFNTWSMVRRWTELVRQGRLNEVNWTKNQPTSEPSEGQHTPSNLNNRFTEVAERPHLEASGNTFASPFRAAARLFYWDGKQRFQTPDTEKRRRREWLRWEK